MSLQNSRVEEFDSLRIVCNEFVIENPIVIQKKPKLRLFKQLSKDGQYFGFYTPEFLFSQMIDIKRQPNIIIFMEDLNYTNSTSLENVLKQFNNILLVYKDLRQVDPQLKLEISQKVYLLDESSNKVFERYEINGLTIKTQLGKVENKTFVWEPGTNKDFMERRSDFQGAILKVMTEDYGTNLLLNSTYKTKAPFYPSNQTYLVNRYINGLYYEVLHELEKHLNFSSVIYKRKVTSWGFVYPQDNGSVIGTGIVGDIYFKRADLIAAPLTATYSRSLHIDFMPPITRQIIALWIANQDSQEDFDFDTFVTPLNFDLWIAVILATLGLTVLKSLGLSKMTKIKVSDVVCFSWTSFIGFFGGKPNPTKMDKLQAYKITIFISLLCGTVVWIAYRSYLTAELSVMIKSYPFHDLDSFSNTNWRYAQD